MADDEVSSTDFHRSPTSDKKELCHIVWKLHTGQRSKPWSGEPSSENRSDQNIVPRYDTVLWQCNRRAFYCIVVDHTYKFI